MVIVVQMTEVVVVVVVVVVVLVRMIVVMVMMEVMRCRIIGREHFGVGRLVSSGHLYRGRGRLERNGAHFAAAARRRGRAMVT